jgi:hypothetical protein
MTFESSTEPEPLGSEEQHVSIHVMPAVMDREIILDYVMEVSSSFTNPFKPHVQCLSDSAVMITPNVDLSRSWICIIKDCILWRCFEKCGAEDPLVALQADLTYTVILYVPSLRPKLERLRKIMETATGIPVILRAMDIRVIRYVVQCRLLSILMQWQHQEILDRGKVRAKGCASGVAVSYLIPMKLKR